MEKRKQNYKFYNFAFTQYHPLRSHPGLLSFFGVSGKIPRPAYDKKSRTAGEPGIAPGAAGSGNRGGVWLFGCAIRGGSVVSRRRFNQNAGSGQRCYWLRASKHSAKFSRGDFIAISGAVSGGR